MKSLLKIWPLLLLPASPLFAQDVEFSGHIGVEQRYFWQSGAYQGQLDNHQSSVYIEPELYRSVNDGNGSVVFKPYLRVDSQDSQRTHFDIRELSYVYAGDGWELRTGIRKEYWGVTEFQHLVDVINQTDTVNSFDGEDKLGQAMVNLSLVKDWGIVDLYVLPGFREQIELGQKSRLRGPVSLKDTEVTYESSDEEQHIDYAVRWSHSFVVFDVGAYWFSGTNRQPLINAQLVNGQMQFSQYYQQMDQLAIDVQATVDNWLWKFETLYRDSDLGDFSALQAGVEYSFYGIADSDIDFGLLTEYGWDSRGIVQDPLGNSAFQNDLFVGGRFAFNDVQSSEILMGFGYDLDYESTSFMIEGNRRFGESIIVSLDVRLFNSEDVNDPMLFIDKDDHVQLSAEWYF